MAPKSLQQSLKENPTALGDPVSLKAEKSSNEPTDQDRPVSKQHGADYQHYRKGSSKGEKSLKELAEDKLKKGNASQLGDPVSLKAETSEHVPKPEEEGAKRRSKL